MVIPWILLAIVVVGVLLLMSTKVLCWCPNSITSEAAQAGVSTSRSAASALPSY